MLFASPHLGSLEELNLARSNVGTANVAALAACPRLTGLRALDLEGCDVRDEGVEALVSSGIHGLEHLRLNANQISERGAALLAGWAGLASVRTLSLGANYIRNEGLEALAGSPHIGNLVSLDLSSTGLNAAGARLVERLASKATSLAHINLLSGGLRQTGMTALKKSPHMAGVITWGRSLPEGEAE
jgi:hypothetical protein